MPRAETGRPDVQKFDTADSWTQAWTVKREQGWETLLVDGDADGLHTILYHPTDCRYQVIRLNPGASVSLPLPAEIGIGESITSLQLAVESLPWLHWRQAYRDRSVLGKGIFTYPLGPVRGDVAESVFYRLQVMGDDIVRLTVENGFKRRSIRELCRGRSIADALLLVERMTTTSTVAHALAYSLAVEDCLGVRIAPETSATRVLAAEMERLVSHAGDLATLAVSTGLSVPQMEYLSCKESVLRVNFDLFGHRYLRGVIRPGGAAALRDHAPSNDELASAHLRLVKLLNQMRSVKEDLLRTPSFLDRLHGAGTIPEQTREFVRPVGPIGRSVGRSIDARKAHPYLMYADLRFEVPERFTGDAFARYVVKAEEFEESFSIVLQLLSAPESLGFEAQDLSSVAESGLTEKREATAWVEAPRGLMAYRVVLTGDCRVDHVGIATPSQRNWYAFAPAVANHNILQDFPIIDASFHLSVAGWDG